MVVMGIKRDEQEAEVVQMNVIVDIAQGHLAGGIVHGHHDKVQLVVIAIIVMCYISSGSHDATHTQ